MKALKSKKLQPRSTHQSELSGISSVIETGATSHKAVIRLYDDGWTPIEIAQKLNMSIVSVIHAISAELKHTA